LFTDYYFDAKFVVNKFLQPKYSRSKLPDGKQNFVEKKRGLVNLRPPTTVFFKRQAQLSDKRAGARVGARGWARAHLGRLLSKPFHRVGS
jgi:hypothetical protein